MSSSFKNNKFQILILSLACTLIIFNIYKNPNISTYSFHKLSINLRNLISVDQIEKRCQNTPKNFLEKYKKTNYPESQSKEKELDRYQKVLKEMIEKKNIKKINKYLPRIIIFFVIAIVDIILIILWIVFCSCCCCCCKKQKTSATGCSKCYFFLFFFLSIIVILICIFGYIKTPGIIKSFNSTICSLYKLVFHITDGTEEDFPGNNWKGIEGLNLLINQYKDIKIWKENSGNSIACGTSNAQLCSEYNKLNGILKEDINNKMANNDAFINKLDEPKTKIEKMTKVFNDFKTKELDDIEKIMEKFDKYGKLGLFVLFSAIIAFCFFCLLILSSYFICNCNCMSCLYHIFWNIEMLIIIVTMLIGVCLGLIGVISKDFIEILKYTKSDKNLNAEKPFLLDFDKSQSELLTICLNGNGTLKDSIFSEPYNGSYQTNIKESNFSEFLEEYKKMEKTDPNKSDYDKMNEIRLNIKNLKNSLSGDNILDKIFDCKFFQWDFEILTKELKDSISKNLTLYSLIIIVADLVAFISLFFGIIIVNNYKGKDVEPESHDRHIQMNVKGARPNMDSSSDNLRK